MVSYLPQVFSAELLCEKAGCLGGGESMGSILVVLPIVLVCLKAPLNLVLHLLLFKRPKDEFDVAHGILNAVFPSR